MGSTSTPAWDVRIGSAEIGLNVQNSNPPTSAYVGKDDSLWIMCSNTVGNLATVNARFLMPNGDIKLNQWTLNFGFSRAAQFKQIQLPECFLLSVAIVVNTQNAATNGNNYVAAIVSRIVPTNFNAAQVLCQGYSWGTMPISWPTGVNTNNVDCAGVTRSNVGTVPGAGLDFSTTVPLNAKWRLVSFFATFQCSAAAGNRFPSLIIDDGANLLAKIETPTPCPANLNINLTWAVGLPSKTQTWNADIVPVPSPMFLWPGFRIRTSTVGLQVADQYQVVNFLIEEWMLP